MLCKNYDESLSATFCMTMFISGFLPLFIFSKKIERERTVQKVTDYDLSK